jgi:hypothetical protein
VYAFFQEIDLSIYVYSTTRLIVPLFQKEQSRFSPKDLLDLQHGRSEVRAGHKSGEGVVLQAASNQLSTSGGAGDGDASAGTTTLVSRIQPR